MELLPKECNECRLPKMASISIATNCFECGLDRKEITYEIPADKFSDIIRELFSIIDKHHLQPKAGQKKILTYEELLLKLQA